MRGILGVVVSVSGLSEARRLIALKDKVRALAEELFREIEAISGRSLPDLGICLHDQFSSQICAPLPHLPAWYSEKVIHFLADVDWWQKDSKGLLKQRHIAGTEGASQVIKEYYEALDLEFLVFLLCGHEACHHLGLFEQDEKYYRVAPRWIEEGLYFYIPYEIIGRKRKRLTELALRTDRILFEALRQPLIARRHWLYEFYNFDAKYSKVGEEFKNLIDAWDYSASTVAVHELSIASQKSPKELLDAVSNAYKHVKEDLNMVKANREFMEALFFELGIQDTIVDNFCSRFRVCPSIILSK